MMWIFEIRNDRFNHIGNTERLGWKYGTTILPDLSDWDEFPFTRCCFSIGDLGIVSALPQLLKSKYPNLTISLPSSKWVKECVGQGTWAYQNSEVSDNLDLIYANNPYVDYRFEPGQHELIYNDHHRCYRYETEPLIEQLLRAWGFTEEEIETIDSRPQLYFNQEEKEIGDSIIKKWIGNLNYGCSIFASRLDKYNYEWEGKNIDGIYNESLKYKDYPVFYYSSFNFPTNKNKWNTAFKEWISFKDIPEATIRIQMYIKQQALFNLGYQSGLGDACTGKSMHYVATPYEKLTETVLRGDNIYYYFPNGQKVCFKN